jgi:hypothetical protein
MSKYINWSGFQDDVESHVKKHGGISAKMLKSMFDSYSVNNGSSICKKYPSCSFCTRWIKFGNCDYCDYQK